MPTLIELLREYQQYVDDIILLAEIPAPTDMPVSFDVWKKARQLRLNLLKLGGLFAINDREIKIVPIKIGQ